MAQTSKDFHEILNKELSIQISLSGLSFCILQKDSNSIEALKDINFGKRLNHIELLERVKTEFNSNSELNQEFSNVTVIHDNDLSNFVPTPFFNEDHLSDYLKFNTKILKSDFIATDEVALNDSKNIYVPFVNINNYIYDTFGEFTFKHISTILVETILQMEKNSEIPKIFINVKELHFEMTVVNKGKLILYNTFEYQTKEDFIYYILFTAEQLELNPESFELILTGNIDKHDERYVIAHKYIQFVSFGKRNDTFKYKLEAQPNTNYSDFVILNSF
ncbi:DUF3822 family protein [Aestuariibaculum sediminum]|uniref:DUF3822 family protein n=1 Tax=Aestuariibaculum sediminum TaxID=2770637 RepID=A0A8J6QAP1_9FLAO|nr:DUF3822 family protein [Aestuariibaculum sediminum]MBD0833697.1 DUF3822 family protein [Aestuariibaculum sediminum]